MVGKPLSLPKAMKTIILFSFCFPFLSFAANTSMWSQWRGPDRNGMISNDNPWPSKIDKESLTEKWRVSLGKGYSGPVVSENLVFTTESPVDSDRKTWASSQTQGSELPIAKMVNLYGKRNGREK